MKKPEERKSQGFCPHDNYPSSCPTCAELDNKKITEGQSIEVIEKIGWGNYRERVAKLSYADFIKNQAAQIASLESQSQQPKPEWIMSQENVKAAQRAGELSKWMVANYGKDKPANFVAYRDGNKKLMVRGRNISLNQNGAPKELPVTRIYLAAPTRTSPEAMRALFTTLVDESAMADSDLALNLESYDSQRTFENNTLIVYVYGHKPEVVAKVVKAIQRAKQQNSNEIWRLAPHDLAKAKKETLGDFMIPLDDTTAFVEADNLGSYHFGPRGRMYAEITADFTGRQVDLAELEKSMRPFTPSRPGLFEQEPSRRRYMPGLIQK